MNLFDCVIMDRQEKLLNILSKNSRLYLPKLTTSIMKCMKFSNMLNINAMLSYYDLRRETEKKNMLYYQSLKTLIELWI